MRNFIAILLILFIWNVYAQKDTVQIDTDIGSTVTVDFNLIILPLKTTSYEYYQIGIHNSINHKISIGMRLGYSIREFKAFPVERKESITVSVGCNWKLMPNQKWFIDPSVNLMYIADFDRLTVESYRGGGVLFSINVGYQFKLFRLGIRSQSGYSIGHLSRVNGMPFMGFAHRMNAIDYGLHFSWNL